MLGSTNTFMITPMSELKVLQSIITHYASRVNELRGSADTALTQVCRLLHTAVKLLTAQALTYFCGNEKECFSSILGQILPSHTEHF